MEICILGGKHAAWACQLFDPFNLKEVEIGRLYLFADGLVHFEHAPATEDMVIRRSRSFQF